jgi:hypothetical protein
MVASVIDPKNANGADVRGAFGGWLCINGTTGANKTKIAIAATVLTKISTRTICALINKSCFLLF